MSGNLRQRNPKNTGTPSASDSCKIACSDCSGVVGIPVFSFPPRAPVLPLPGIRHRDCFSLPEHRSGPGSECRSRCPIPHPLAPSSQKSRSFQANRRSPDVGQSLPPEDPSARAKLPHRHSSPHLPAARHADSPFCRSRRAGRDPFPLGQRVPQIIRCGKTNYLRPPLRSFPQKAS